MTPQPVRAYFIEGEISGEPFALLQIEITCAECGVVPLLIPAHHLRTVRDVIIDHLDQMPELAEGKPTTKVSTTDKVPLNFAHSQKAEEN